MKVLNKIVISEAQPVDKNVLWIEKDSTGSLSLKSHVGKWKTIGDKNNSDNLKIFNYPLNALDNSISLQRLSPNTYNTLICTLDAYSLDFEHITNTNQYDEYIIEIDCTNKVSAIKISSDIKWANDEAPVLEAGHLYVVSVINGLGVWGQF